MNAGGLPVFGAHRPPLEPYALARTILSERRFRVRVTAPARKTWWDVLVGWLGDRWHDLLGAFGKHVHVSPRVTVAAGDIVIVVVTALVIFVAVRLLSQYIAEGVSQLGTLRAVPSHAGAVELYEMSLEASRRGDYGAAVALLFRASLAVLDLRGVVHDDPSSTVNESRRQVRRTEPRLVEPFEVLARAFTAVVYADAPVSQTQWANACEAYLRLSDGMNDEH